MAYIKSNLDPGFLNKLHNAFMEDLKPSFSKLDCGIKLNGKNWQIILDFNEITKKNIYTLHMLCNKHQRTYYIKAHTTKGRTAFVVNPPVNWH